MRRHTSTTVLIASTVAVLLMLTGCTSSAPEPEPQSPTTSPSAEPRADLPRVALARGAVDGWTLADALVVAAVLPEVGDAAEGGVALGIEAPVIDGPVVAASTRVSVAPGAELSLGFSVRALREAPTAVPIVVVIGGVEVPLPELNAEWSSVRTQITAPADVTELAIEIRLDGPVVGFSLDDVSLTASDGAELVGNGSFENVTAPWGIVSDSLVVNAMTGALAVAMAPGEANWSLSRNGAVVTSGVSALEGAVAAIPLDGAVQGYYDLTVTDSSGAPVSTTLAVLDAEGYGLTADARFGVGVHVEEELYVGAARYVRSLGLSEARNDILWSRNETVRGQYDWHPSYVQEFTRLHVNGIKLMAISNYGNKLYGSGQTPDNPEAIAAYGRYSAAIAERFDLVGLEVFNEFNHERFNATGCGVLPACYLPLLQSVYDNVRAVAPDLPIVAGSTANYDAAWFDGLWQAGGLEYADAVSYHPYQIVPNPDGLADIIAASRTSMQSNGAGTLPIWITELGATSNDGVQSIDGQATFLLKSVITAVGNGVEKFFWYDLINDSLDSTDHEGNFGLFSQPTASVAALAPKPSAFVYALLVNELNGHAVRSSAPALGEGVVAYTFGDDDPVTVAWAPGGDTSVRVPAEQPVEVIDIDGKISTISPVAGEAEIPVTQRGVIVRAPVAVAAGADASD